MRTMAGAPATVALVVWLVYGAWIAGAVRGGRAPIDFVVLGRNFVQRAGQPPLPPGEASPHIRLDPRLRLSPWGYDGQFCYFIAVDPLRARHYIDAPAIRYARLLYPLAARALALGHAERVPLALLGLNWLATGAIALGLAAWLRRRGQSPWLALVVAFYPGLFLALTRDLTEPLAWALTVAAVVVHDGGPRTRRRRDGAALLFALAFLTRETVALFALAAAAALGRDTADRRRWLHAARFLALALGPGLIWRAALWHWFGDFGFNHLRQFQWLPFAGILHYWPFDAEHLEQARTVALPGLFCLYGAVRLAAERGRREAAIPAALLVASAGIFVALLAADSYSEIMNSARHALAVPVAALLCLPGSGRRRGWFYAAAALWLAPMPFWLAGLR